MKKLTRTNFKSFVKKNYEQLFHNLKSDFDGMTDGIEYKNGGFKKIVPTSKNLDTTLGVSNLWLVGGGGFMLKSARENYENFNITHDNLRKEFLSNQDNLLNAIVYEMLDHEFCYTFDYDDICNAVGIENNGSNIELLQQAKQIYFSKIDVDNI